MLRVVMPVYNNAIINNQKIQSNLAEANRVGVDAYKRTLIAEVKTAYFNYWKAAEAFELYENTVQLVDENLRTSESLFKNHQVTKDVVYLAAAQVEEVKQQLAEAEKNKKVAQSFFNFLLNKDYDAPILVTPTNNTFVEVASLAASRQQALQQREELNQLSYVLAATDHKIQINKGSYLPTVNLVADYGIQGTRYSFTNEDDFFMGSLVMSWKLFQPTQKAKTQQAQLEKQEIHQQKEGLQQQIGLQVVQAWYDVEAARKSVTQAAAETKATQQAFRLIHKKFEQGQANLVTWTDARTRQTNAEQKTIIARYDYQIKLATLEEVSAAYPIQKK
jgi:outer membrane protein TolC